MFLPVLLVRDYGIWGFAVFAVPNVLGAAGMGWVLRSREASVRLVDRHAGAAVWFSAVTIVFQAFFLGFVAWLFSEWFHEVYPRLVLLIAVAVFSAALLHGVVLGVGAYVVSAALALVFLANADWPPPHTWVPPSGWGNDSTIPLIWLAPVTSFGFLLCPYLDLTFHKARQSLGLAPARVAFTLGFGVFFLSMIVFTLAYSGLFLHDLWYFGDELAVLVFVHMALQASFTAGIHLRAIAHQPKAGGTRSLPWWVSVGAVVALFMVMFEWRYVGIWDWRPGLEISPAFETLYRMFMAFYGLVFPAYVWLCVIPTRDGHSGPSRWKVLVLAGAVGMAAPMFYMGFIERQTAWLGPGLGVVLLARLLVRGQRAAAGQ